MAAGEIRIQASTVGTRQDLREVLAIAAAGKARCQVTTRPLADANEALNQLRRGQVSGRLVLASRDSADRSAGGSYAGSRRASSRAVPSHVRARI
jgi:hypothetical protein